jgi:hypothetical protein
MAILKRFLHHILLNISEYSREMNFQNTMVTTIAAKILLKYNIAYQIPTPSNQTFQDGKKVIYVNLYKTTKLYNKKEKLFDRKKNRETKRI